MKEKFKKLKDENKILIMLAFFSISVGLWGNFRQLWLQDNNMAVSQISNTLSIATFLCAICIFFFMTKTSITVIKKIICTCLILKVINLIVLYILNATGMTNFIMISTIFDVILEKLIITSIYPFLITIKKTDELYSKRKLVEYLFRDFGILVGGIFIGRAIGRMTIDYNALLLVAIVFLLISYLVLQNIQQTIMQQKRKDQKQIIKEILKDSIVKIYVVCYFIGTIAMQTGLGLKMLMLTNSIGLSASVATNYLLIIGLLADAIGIVALKYFTPKNDYITITIKFGIRFFNYVLAFLSNNMIMIFIAITWSIIISTAYENKTDAPYINRVKNENQIVFTNMRYLVGAVAEAIGLFLAGVMYQFGIASMLGLSAFFMIFQIGLCYVLIHRRQKEESEGNNKVIQDSTYQKQGVIISIYQDR